MANQITFDFGANVYPNFDDFLGQGNAELISLLKEQSEPFIYLWGEAGTGKTSLLKSWASRALEQQKKAVYVDVHTMGLPEEIRDNEFLAIDGVEELNDAEQIRLFSIFNQIKDQRKGFLLIASATPPWQLDVREDLRTRMGYCLVYEVTPLTDIEKITALNAMAKKRQLHVSDEVFIYLLNHWRRDMDSLISLLDVLDQYSLAVKKPITVPLVKKVLGQGDKK